MKNATVYALIVTLFCLGAGASAGSMDPAVVGPDVYKMVFENAKVRVFEVTFKPGDVVWINAESHKAENMGPGEVKLVVTELKGSKTMKKKAPAPTPSK